MEMILLALCPAVLALWAYRQGLRDGMAKAQGQPPERIATRPKRKPPAPSAEQRRLEQILANVEAYDGTSYGQKEVV